MQIIFRNIFQELKLFSRENWWIFPIFFLAIGLVYFTQTWNISELAVLFLLNFLWNVFVMIMQKNYTHDEFKIGSLFHVLLTIIFSWLSIYGLLVNGQSQYLLWQVMYILAATKAFAFYYFHKNITLFRGRTFFFINIILLAIFIYYFDFFNNASISSQYYALIQWAWFALVTTGLVSLNDTFRYYMSYIGAGFITLWSFISVINSYVLGAVDWVAFWYFLLTLAVVIYYTKLLPKYLKK